VACEQLAPTEYLKRHDGPAKIIHQKLAEVAKMIEEKTRIISTHQAMYWRMTISSCTGTAAHLRTKQYLSTDLTLTFINKKTKNTFLLDTAVPNTHNFAKQ
jgi:hypothetical protein